MWVVPLGGLGRSDLDPILKSSHFLDEEEKVTQVTQA